MLQVKHFSSCKGEKMKAPEPFRFSDREVSRLDPYAFMAAIGKKVIHPGGRRSTEELFHFADLQPGQRVLDVGAGVGTTAIAIARRFHCRVTAVDIDPAMLSRARANVRAAGLDGLVTVAKGNIESLPFADETFDRVLIEAVLMFVDKPRAVGEIARVCRPEGLILDHEFIYREAPTPKDRCCFEEVCPGSSFDTAEGWLDLYRQGGLVEIRHITGPFAMMTAGGMLKDEGMGNLLAMFGRVLARPAYLRKMAWIMSRMLRVRSELGYLVLAAAKPSRRSEV
jgi:SAM-dependent methyltransferase